MLSAERFAYCSPSFTESPLSALERAKRLLKRDRPTTKRDHQIGLPSEPRTLKCIGEWVLALTAERNKSPRLYFFSAWQPKLATTANTYFDNVVTVDERYFL